MLLALAIIDGPNGALSGRSMIGKDPEEDQRVGCATTYTSGRVQHGLESRTAKDRKRLKDIAEGYFLLWRDTASV